MIKYILAGLLIGCLTNLTYGQAHPQPIVPPHTPQTDSEKTEVKKLLELGREQERESRDNPHWMPLSVPVCTHGIPGWLNHYLVVLQIIDESHMLVNFYSPNGSGTVPYMVQGFSTAGLTDGKEIELDWPVQYSKDTSTYLNVLGVSKTVEIIELYPVRIEPGAWKIHG